METTVEYNRELCKRYPFLKPGGARFNDDGFDYTYTLLDDMPDGWRIAFGERLCEELLKSLERAGGDRLEDYAVIQIKEKFGGLRWYDNGLTDEGYEILDKYKKLSERTCICCGKPATKITKGWISPYCDDCIRPGADYWTVKEFFKDGGS